MNRKETANKLREHGLRVTPQRVWIYEYLCTHRTHPSADEIYSYLCEQGANVTLATVYNVLCTLCEHGLIIEIKTDSNHIRYDADVSMHGHFSCDRCGKIYDFQIKSLDYAGLDGFKTRQRDVYFAGVCNKCNNKKGEKENG